MHAVIGNAGLAHRHGAGVEQHVVSPVRLRVGYESCHVHRFCPPGHVDHVEAGADVGVVHSGPGPRHDQVQGGGGRGGGLPGPGHAGHQHHQPRC